MGKPSQIPQFLNVVTCPLTLARVVYRIPYWQRIHFLGAFENLLKSTIISVMSVRPFVCPNGTTRFSVSLTFIFEDFSRTCGENLSVINFHEELCACMIMPRWITLRLWNVSDKSFWENQGKHFLFSKFSENHAVCEIMRKTMVEPDRPLMTI